MNCYVCNADIGENIGACNSCKCERDIRHAQYQDVRKLDNSRITTSPDAVPAGFWLRFIAVTIDHAILSLFFTVIGAFVLGPLTNLIVGKSVVLGHLDGAIDEASVAILSSPLAFAVVSMVLSLFLVLWLYFALFESSRLQATPGKLIMGLQVTNLSGERIGFIRASVRFFSRILCYLSFLIGYAMAGFTSNKQGAHDLLASTLVLRETPYPKSRVFAGIMAALSLSIIAGLVDRTVDESSPGSKVSYSSRVR